MTESGITRWENRVALVTGAGIGIGAAVCKTLVKNGLIVIGCARNKARIEDIAKECEKSGYKGKLHSYQCDLNNESEISEMFDWIKNNHGGVDVCVANAGFAKEIKLIDINAEEMKGMLDTNVVALVLCTNKAIRSMEERGVNDGQIIHINSMLGHRLKEVLHFYSATKHAVTAITEGFRRELFEKKSKIRVTAISPAFVGSTNFVDVAYGSDRAEKIKGSNPPCLLPQDVADAVFFALTLPSNALVGDIRMQGVEAIPI